MPRVPDLIQFTPGSFGWTTPLGMQYVTRAQPPFVDDGDLVESRT
jgi:hypothetical protein